MENRHFMMYVCMYVFTYFTSVFLQNMENHIMRHESTQAYLHRCPKFVIILKRSAQNMEIVIKSYIHIYMQNKIKLKVI